MMENTVKVLKAVYDNIPLIITAALLIAGIGLRVKKFLKLSKEEKKEMLQKQSERITESVKAQLLALVSKAEKNWGGGTGRIKKAEVWEKLLSQSGKLEEYIEMGLIDKKVVDDLIDEAVTELQKILDGSAAAKAAIEQPTQEQTEGQV